MMPCPPLVFAGLDFILDHHGSWHFLEVNDHPAALAAADAIAVAHPAHLFDANGMRSLAVALGDLSSGKHVCLVLPDCFEVSDPDHVAVRIEIIGDQSFDDTRILTTIEDFNTLMLALRDIGVPCLIADLQGVQVQDQKAFLLDATEIGCLFRRSYSFPAKNLKIPCVNELRSRALCTDKALTFQALRALCPEVTQVETHSHASVAALEDFLERMARANAWIIEKPRRGSASDGIQRRRAQDVIGELRRGSLKSTDCIYQPWIEPMTIRSGGFDYYADVRVYCVHDKAVAGFARRSAAPSEGVMAGSMLSLLTTSGQRAPMLRESSSMGLDEPALYMSNTSFDKLLDLSHRIMQALNAAIDSSDMTLASKSIGGFRQLLSIEGEIQPVKLAAREF